MPRGEAIIVRRSGGGIVEFRLIPPNQGNNKSFATDNVIRGSMDTISLEKFNNLLLWLQQNGRLAETEEMIKIILKNK